MRETEIDKEGQTEKKRMKGIDKEVRMQGRLRRRKRIRRRRMKRSYREERRKVDKGTRWSVKMVRGRARGG